MTEDTERSPLAILLACQPIPGHLYPNLALAKALRERGHRVAVYSGAMARKQIEENGFDYFPFDAAMDETLSRVLLPANGHSRVAQITANRNQLLQFTALNEIMKEWLLETVPNQVADLRRIAADYQADAICTDWTLFGPTLVLKEMVNIPVIVFSVLAGYSIPQTGDPPWGLGLPSPKGSIDRARYRLAQWISRFVLSGFRNYADQLRTDHGLPKLSVPVLDETARVPLFMVSSCPSLDYDRRDLPENVRYVGPCVWDSGAAASVPKWLEELAPDPPVVHVTEGTVFTRRPLVLSAATRGLSDARMQVIMTTGRHRNPADLDLGVLGPNIRVEQFVSHKHLFAKTHAVVTTGGAGTVTAALVAGIPLVIVPAAWELAENAQRVAEAGAGIRLAPKDCSPQRLREAVERILSEHGFRDNARRLGQDLLDQGGVTRACGLIEDTVGGGRMKPRRDNYE